MKIIKINAVWCPACILTNKIWKKAKEDFSDLKIEELDYDFDEDEVKKYDVGKVLPVVIFMRDGMEVERLVGEKNREEIYAAIDRNK